MSQIGFGEIEVIAGKNNYEKYIYRVVFMMITGTGCEEMIHGMWYEGDVINAAIVPVENPKQCLEKCLSLPNCIAWGLAPDSKCYPFSHYVNTYSVQERPGHVAGRRNVCIGNILDQAIMKKKYMDLIHSKQNYLFKTHTVSHKK